MNKKGFTVVELIVSFALTMIVVALLFQMLLGLKDLYISSGFKSQLLNKQALMSSKINNDFKNKEITMALKCGANCLTFFFNDDTSNKLIIDDKNDLFAYGEYSTKLVDGSKFGDVVIRNETISILPGDLSNTKFDSFIEIKIPIKHTLLKEDYGVYILYQYNSNATSISNITFDDTFTEEFKIMLKGSSNHKIPAGSTWSEPGWNVLNPVDGSINPAGYNVTVTGTVSTTQGATSTLTYTLRNPSNQVISTTTRTVTAIQSSYDFAYAGTSGHQFSPQVEGVYRFELWGASGGGTAGLGGYTSGDIYLDPNNPNHNFYIYVGLAGVLGTFGNNTTMTVGQGAGATFNGGGAGGNAGGNLAYPWANYRGGPSGGGATDIRLINGNWDDINGLRSRIMVAGGGGGTSAGTVNYDSQRSHAGELIGQNGAVESYLAGAYEHHVIRRGQGATQTTGNALGRASNGSNSGATTLCNGHGGGGGGYYGGIGGLDTGGSCHVMGGGGGSSFISGHPGSNALDINGNHINQSIHFSGLSFTNTTMIGGNGVMPAPLGGTETGHSGNGRAKITLVSIVNFTSKPNV